MKCILLIALLLSSCVSITEKNWPNDHPANPDAEPTKYDSRQLKPLELHLQNENQTSQDREIEYFSCPMHPKIKQELPGKCPKCKMRLRPKYKGEQE